MVRKIHNQPQSQRSRIAIKDVSNLLQFAAVILVTLFIAGVAAPSFLRPEAARNQALASGSLHTLTVARVTFTYTFWNLASAILGTLFGAVAVLLKTSPISPSLIARINGSLRQMHRKWRPARRSRRPSYLGSGLLS